MIERCHRAIGLLALAAVICVAVPVGVTAQEPGTVVDADSRVMGLSYVFEETGVEVPYALFVPSNYDASRAWPLIVALHGLGRPYDWMMGYDGNIDAAERDWFGLLTAVQGVGARVALAILTVLEPDVITDAVIAQDKVAFTQAAGVGSKLAARLVAELKDRVGDLVIVRPVQFATEAHRDVPQMTRADATVLTFDIRNGRPTGSDAIEKVTHVIHDCLQLAGSLGAIHIVKVVDFEFITRQRVAGQNDVF